MLPYLTLREEVLIGTQPYIVEIFSDGSWLLWELRFGKCVVVHKDAQGNYSFERRKIRL